MEDIAKLVDKIAVMHRGKMIKSGPPREIFGDYKGLTAMGLGIPQITELMLRLREKGKAVAGDILTVEEARVEILKAIRRKGSA
jgi:energy-coupling factor transport system ATP-binding protein